MKNRLAINLGILGVSVVQCFSQTTLQFTGINTTPELAIQLHWARNTNEIYQIEYANALATDTDGSTAWKVLCEDYPAHQGSNTFWLDAGNYDLSPVIPHPKNSPMRFYRVMLVGTNTSSDNPTVSIVYPTNSAALTGKVTVSVAAASSQVLERIVLYVDGQEMWPSDDGTNFVINTCEWWNGTHTLFAAAKSVSHFPGQRNSGFTYGHAVSQYVNVAFDNLISEVAFSEPYFEPSLGQTQKVTASFAANCDWSLEIQDANGSAVRHASGSGISLAFDWDGTGDGGTNIPDGVYTFFISAQTNGAASESPGVGGGSGSGSPPLPSFASSSANASELWTIPADGSGSAVPLALYPPGFDTDDFLIFESSASEMRPQVSTLSKTALAETEEASPAYAGPSAQSTSTPERPPSIEGKGTTGTFLVGYQTYFNPPFATFTTPPIPSGNIVVNKWVILDEETSQSQAAGSQTWLANIPETPDIANGFAGAMRKGRWSGSVNPQITATHVTGGYFNQANIGLLCVHASCGKSPESDSVTRSYLRFWDYKTRSPSYCRLDDCHFGSAGTNGLKWMAILGCNVLTNVDYNSLYIYGRLPITSDLHLLLSASTVVTFAPDIGRLWAEKMLGDGTTNIPPETVTQAWFDAGSEAYLKETQPLRIIFRVAGWSDAFDDHVTDIDSSPGSGNPLDIEKQDSTVFNNP